VGSPIIPELSYAEWGRGLWEKAARNRTPLVGSLDLTFRCNNNCIHCYCNKSPHDAGERAREMDTALISRIIGEIVDAGCLWLLLTGGEPLIRSDFREIYLQAKKRGMLVTIFTNGTLIDEEDADFLAEWRPSSVEVTLYGATQKTYEDITQVHGSYKRCMRGIELLLQRKVALKLKTMAMRQNVREIPMMKEYAESMGLEFRFDPLVNARLDSGRGPLSSRLGVEDVLRLDREDGMRWRELGRLCRENAGDPGSAMLYSCGAGGTSFHVDPYGKLCMCVMARNQSYDLRDGRFGEGWSVFLKDLKAKKTSAGNRCRTCGLRSLCGQCPGWSQVEHGDDETPVAFLCEIAYNRAEAFELETGRKAKERSYEETL
jgi:radical SAM protein with 4Fe4S-binding SPASM domain